MVWLNHRMRIPVVDVHAHMPIANQSKVKAVPALIFIKDGEEVDRTGLTSKETIVKKLAGLLVWQNRV